MGFYGYRSFGGPFDPMPGAPAPSSDGLVPLGIKPWAPTPAQQIVTAMTPAAAAAAAAPPSSTATVPVARTEAAVFPTSKQVPGSTVSSLPIDFPSYTIRPEVLGPPVHRGVVPGMYDPSSLMSLFPSLTMSSPLDRTPQLPQPVEPLAPPSPVDGIFNSHAGRKVTQAALLDHAASLHADVANDLQRKADKAVYDANQAASKATVDPTFDAQAAALAAAARAKNAQARADTAAEKAVLVNQQADVKAAQAQEAIVKLNAAQDRRDTIFDQSVARADQRALDQVLDTPGQAFPEMFEPVAVQGFSVSPVVAAGVAGVVGFLLGGARGGAVGALLGGGMIYFMQRR
jgi:hypothetical protein